MSELISKDYFGDIVLLTLNRPEKRNALNPQLVDRLSAVLDEVATDDRLRAVILTGAGKAFCAGADLAYLRELSEYSDEENQKDSEKLAGVYRQLYQLPRLTIAMINGPALAGGAGLALCCDYRFGSQEHTKFGFTEVRIGFIPAIVMNFLLRRVPPAIAQQLSMSGDILDARRAFDIGLLNGTFPTGQLREQVIRFTSDQLSQNSFAAMMQTKRLYQQLLEVPLTEGLELASHANARSRKTADCRKGIRAFLNKEKIRWRT